MANEGYAGLTRKMISDRIRHYRRQRVLSPHSWVPVSMISTLRNEGRRIQREG